MAKGEGDFAQKSAPIGPGAHGRIIHFPRLLLPKKPRPRRSQTTRPALARKGLAVVGGDPPDLPGVPDLANQIAHHQRDLAGNALVGAQHQSARKVFGAEAGLIRQRTEPAQLDRFREKVPQEPRKGDRSRTIGFVIGAAVVSYAQGDQTQQAAVFVDRDEQAGAPDREIVADCEGSATGSVRLPQMVPSMTVGWFSK